MPSVDLSTFVQPGADYTRITPIDQKITITLINEYIASTASFLSEFLGSTDRKLIALQRRTNNCASILSILDAKLASIGPLAPQSAVPAPAQSNVDTDNIDVPEPEATDDGTLLAEDELMAHLEGEEAGVEEPEPAFDAAYLSFLKQLKVGVHPMQVRVNMITAGLDPDPILDQDGSVKINIQQTINSFQSSWSAFPESRWCYGVSVDLRLEF